MMLWKPWKSFQFTIRFIRSTGIGFAIFMIGSAASANRRFPMNRKSCRMQLLSAFLTLRGCWKIR